MKHLNNPKNFREFVLPGLIGLGLLWSLGLLGFGLWRQWQQPVDPLTEQPQTSPTNQPLKVATFAQVPNIPLGRFKYGGSHDWSPIRLVVDSAIQSERREYQLSYIQPVNKVANSTIAIELLLKGQLTFVQSGRPLQATEKQQAQNQGIQLQEIPVVLDGIAVAVHPSLPLQGITLVDVAKIYKGQITNWKQLGGPDLAIAPYSLPVESEEVVNLFFQKVMQGDAYGDQLNYFPNMTAALRQLAHSPGGIFFGSAGEIVNQCSIKTLAIGKDSQSWIPPYRLPYVTPSECPLRRNQINTEAFQTKQYALTHPLFVIFKKGDRVEKAGKAYVNMLLTDQGQELIAKAGFVKIDDP